MVETLLEVRGISKNFGDFVANDTIDLRFCDGDIHALLGENGAGKSTLMKIIYGALQPTKGEIFWRGKRQIITSPAMARSLGIAMVYQHFSLFEALSVADNIALALPPGSNLTHLSRDITEVSVEYGLPLNPEALVADLSAGERQRIEIIRCLLQDPKLLIMDEPTAVLTPQESQQLFKTLRQLAAKGCAILYISHRLDEVKDLCHAVTILRHGKVVARTDPTKETTASLARLMVGADVAAIRQKAQTPAKGPALVLRDLSTPVTGPFAVPLQNINLKVDAGEVVAIAGIAGNGQSELFASISGERKLEKPDMISLCGSLVAHVGINKRRKLGAAFVPEERHGHAAVSSFSLSENIILSRHASDSKLIKSGLISRTAAHNIAKRIISAFDVRCHGSDPAAQSLSGGNLQKFIVGRELDRQPAVLVINQPSWGIDAGAAAMIRQSIIDLAATGTAILVISQDLDEIYEIADRIAVICRGELSPCYQAADITRENIGLLMTGAVL